MHLINICLEGTEYAMEGRKDIGLAVQEVLALSSVRRKIIKPGWVTFWLPGNISADEYLKIISVRLGVEVEIQSCGESSLYQTRATPRDLPRRK